MGRRALSLAVLALLATPTAGRAQVLPRLHATLGRHARIVDARGRQVLLRGVNVNELGDYYRVQPALAAVFPLTENDFARIAALGIDSVRLIVSWSALEPHRGDFDEGYLERIRQAVGWARSHGIYVVLDMHQDAWGKYIASPPGVQCPPGLYPAQGWDGAPRWATVTDGLTTCRLQIREVAPAVAQAFTSFWADRDGIQGELVATWARLARAFAADPTVAGYDLLNEPHPGYLPGVTDGTLLGVYYRRAIAAIRRAERTVPGGFSHIAFFEPGALWSLLATDTTPPSALIADRNVVFAPHIYAGSLTADGALGLSLLAPQTGFQLAQAGAAQYGSTVWSGEWGWFGDPARDAPLIAQYAQQEDRYRWGGAWWQWKQACGDPHNFSGPGAQPGSVSPSLNRFGCPGNVPLGIPVSTRRILERPYPRAAPGTLMALTSDPATAAFRIDGRAPSRSSCRLDVWVPGSHGVPEVSATHVTAIAIRPSAGGYRVTGCARRRYSLRSA